jgi:hypothetical protein
VRWMTWVIPSCPWLESTIVVPTGSEFYADCPLFRLEDPPYIV